jgi:hypothetical protein
MTLDFAKWAVILLATMIIAFPVGVGVAVGALTTPIVGLGTGVGALGITSGIGARWLGEE